MVAKKVELAGRVLAGVKVAVFPTGLTVPETATPPGMPTVKDPVLSVAGFISELKVAVTVLFSGTLVAPFVGVSERTVGATGLRACCRPQPARRIHSRNAKLRLRYDIWVTLYSFICASSFSLSE